MSTPRDCAFLRRRADRLYGGMVRIEVKPECSTRQWRAFCSHFLRAVAVEEVTAAVAKELGLGRRVLR